LTFNGLHGVISQKIVICIHVAQDTGQWQALVKVIISIRDPLKGKEYLGCLEWNLEANSGHYFAVTSMAFAAI
jgi:hypothetical protein